MQSFLDAIFTSFQAATTIPVYATYDPAWYDAREASFFTFGWRDIHFDAEVPGVDGFFHAFSVNFTLTLYTIPGEHPAETVDLLTDTVFSGAAAAEVGLTGIEIGAPAYDNTLRRFHISADFTINGIDMREEGAS